MPSEVTSSDRPKDSDSEGGSNSEVIGSGGRDISSEDSSESSAFSKDVNDTCMRRRRAGMGRACT